MGVGQIQKHFMDRIEFVTGLKIIKIGGVNSNIIQLYSGFPGGRVVKNPSTNTVDARDSHLIPGLGRFP